MPAYTIQDYRYAKGKQCLRPVPDGSGWKTRAARLAEGCGGRWVHRAGGYLMSAAGLAKFERLYAAGWDANGFTGKLEAPARAPHDQGALEPTT
jgi:hypothetical protein